MEYEVLKKRIKALDLTMTKFVEYAGYTKTAATYWKHNGVPLPAVRALESLECKGELERLRDKVKSLCGDVDL